MDFYEYPDANGYRPVMDALLPLLRKIGEEQGGKQ